LVARSVWGGKVKGSNPLCPTHKSIMKKMKSFTVEEFQKDFDSLIEKVEQGESFIITSEYGNAIMVPYNYATKILQDSGMDDEILKIHTEHEEGC
jgi:hypothetical protein